MWIGRLEESEDKNRPEFDRESSESSLRWRKLNAQQVEDMKQSVLMEERKWAWKSADAHLNPVDRRKEKQSGQQVIVVEEGNK